MKQITLLINKGNIFLNIFVKITNSLKSSKITIIDKMLLECVKEIPSIVLSELILSDTITNKVFISLNLHLILSHSKWSTKWMKFSNAGGLLLWRSAITKI